MEYLLVAAVSLLVAALTLFSGFGLGSLLMPAFALFFSLPVAVSATAIVHLANNLFKLALVGKHASWAATLRFGIPAIPAAFLGALLLSRIAEQQAWWEYTLAGRDYSVTPVGVVMGTLIISFSLADLLPVFDNLQMDQKWLPFGGLLSGVFGGISGHQGALRAAFLINSGLTKEAFIGTSVVCGVMVDLARITVYGATVLRADTFGLAEPRSQGLLITATIAAFVGSFLGARLMTKVTLLNVRRLVGSLLLVLGFAIALGLV